jgi:hypothetical protein
MSNFKLSDVEYDRFVNWIKTQKFSYSSPLESSGRGRAEAPTSLQQLVPPL